MFRVESYVTGRDGDITELEMSLGRGHYTHTAVVRLVVRTRREAL